MSFSKPLTLNAGDVMKTYKTAYRMKFPWDEILSEDFGRWLSVFDKATNCSKPMIMSGITPLISSLCGPATSIENARGSFKTSLNTYSISVCAPSGGKSNAYNHIFKPVLTYYKEKTGFDLNLESFTIPGVQSHQIKTKGYGIITSDEGNRILTPIKQRNAKGEPDVAFLCKLWGGVGDTSTLSNGQRGFDSTSMSMWLAIQPEPLLSDLPSFKKCDGFLERFLFTVCRPYFVHPDVHEQYFELLKQERLLSLTNVLVFIYESHKHGKRYVLSEEANDEYRDMNVNYYTRINKKYNSDSENSDEEDDDEAISDSFFNSKEIFLILKLATIMHILFHVADAMIRGDDPRDPPLEVPVQALKMATTYYHILAKHRYQLLESISLVGRENTQRLHQVVPLAHRIIRAVCLSHGTATTLRDITAKIKGLSAKEVREELAPLANKGFGKLLDGPRKSTIYFKPHPTSIGPNEVTVLGMSLDIYTANFYNVNHMPQNLIDACLDNHPQHDLIIDILSQYSDDSD